MPVAAVQFSKNNITTTRFGYEVQTYTFGPATLATGTTPVFNLQNWNASGPTTKIVVLLDVAVDPSTAGASLIQLVWNYDGSQSDPGQGFLDGFRAGTVPTPVFATAQNSIFLNVVNNSGAPVPNFQLNYRIAVIELNIAQKILFKVAPTEDEITLINTLPVENNQSAYQQIQGLVAKGTRPFSFEEMYQSIFQGRRVSVRPEVATRHITVPAGSVEGQYNIRVPAGTVLVVRGITLPTAPAALTLLVDRDDDEDYITLNGGAYVRTDGAPLDFWVPASNHFTVTAVGAGGTTYTANLDIDTYQLSDLMKLHLNMAKTPSALYAKVKAGFQ